MLEIKSSIESIIPNYEVLSKEDVRYELIRHYPISKYGGVNFDANEAVPHDKCANIIYDEFKKIQQFSIYIKFHLVTIPYIIMVDIESLKKILKSRLFNSKTLSLYTINPLGCCIVDLPRDNASDFGISVYGACLPFINKFRDLFNKGVVF